MKRLTSILAGGVIVCACGGSSGTGLDDGGGNDASSNDGNNTNDVVSQDGNASDGSSDASDAANCPDFCAAVNPTPTFCSDFDSESTPADWSQTVTSMGGTVTVEQADEVSCPNGLASSLPQITGVQPGISDAKVMKNVASLTPSRTQTSRSRPICRRTTRRATSPSSA